MGFRIKVTVSRSLRPWSGGTGRPEPNEGRNECGTEMDLFRTKPLETILAEAEDKGEEER